MIAIPWYFVEIVERMLSRQNLRMVFDSPIDGCQFISPEDGFFVSTSADHDVKFDWAVIGGRKDAVIPEVEPQYGK